MGIKHGYKRVSVDDGSPDAGAGRGGVVTAVGRQDADVREFHALYCAWFVDVAHWIGALGATPSDQDDLLQEVFVVVHRRLPDFDGRNIAGWLYRITARQVRDFRRLCWVRHIFGRSVPLSENIPSPGASPVMLLERREKQERLDRLLSAASRNARPWCCSRSTATQGRR